MTWLAQTFGVAKPVIGMIHLPPLPGTALYDDAAGVRGIVERARRDADALQGGGIDAVLFGNEGDRPYRTRVGPETVATMAAAVAAVAPDLTVPFGVDVLWDPRATLAVAKATGAGFAREVFTGLFGGDLGLWDTAAGDLFQYRRAIDAGGVRLLFTINAEFAAPVAPRPLAAVARSVAFSSLPDALCVSGPLTGVASSLEELRAAKGAAGATPVFANTGVRRETVAEVLTIADGCIVGTALKVDGVTWNAVDPARVRELMDAARAAR
ncbi:MAG: photosystem I assembly BtpA [uncultured Thermomicrobiales bacterium]|uniref:Photosystem I assembly BtpA n=1 Tax=uncultured Thermomicrobiales bacterium TaxID=1645740 RepID=A0A6J4UZ71_9BACT|nr:MAG: photosystem I assembly BtpA [uncultured Thermomicrobiales bacterium]